MMTNQRVVAIHVIVRERGNAREVHQETFKYVPREYHYDAGTRLVFAKLAYRVHFLDKVKYPVHPAHAWHGKPLAFDAKLAE